MRTASNSGAAVAWLMVTVPRATARSCKVSPRLRCHSTGLLLLPSRRQLKTLEFLIAIFLSQKQFLNPLHTFHRFRTHSVLYQNFGLQHRVLQCGCAECWFFDLDCLFGFLHSL